MLIDLSYLSITRLISHFKDPYYYDKRMKEVERLGVAGAVTETNIEEEGGVKLQLADFYGLSWMHWTYKRYSDWTGDHDGILDGDCTSSNIYDCIKESGVKSYARTYPQAVAGKTVSFTYNDTTSVASLEFIPLKDCKLPTVIFISETWVYTNGFDL